MKPVLIRGICALVVLLSAGYWSAGTVAAHLLPLMQFSIHLLLPDFDVVHLGVEQPAGEAFVVLTVENVRPLFVGRFMPAGNLFDSSTLAAHVMLPAIVCFTLLVTWPVKTASILMARLLCGLAVLILEIPLDVPVVLSGAIVDFLTAANPYASGAPPAVVLAMNVLNGGGRLLLGVVAAASAVVLVHGDSSPVAKDSSNLHESFKKTRHSPDRSRPSQG